MELDGGANFAAENATMQHEQHPASTLFEPQQHAGQPGQMLPPYFMGAPHLASGYPHPMMMPPGMAPPYGELPCVCPHLLGTTSGGPKSHLMPAQAMEHGGLNQEDPAQQTSSQGANQGKFENQSVRTSATKAKTPSGLKQ